jgi:hypothetical protein
MRKPSGSRATWPSSQSVLGLAPMKMNTDRPATRVSSRVSQSRSVTASSDSSPCASTTSVRSRTRMFGAVSIRSTRYCDIESRRSAPRWTIVTAAACCAK